MIETLQFNSYTKASSGAREKYCASEPPFDTMVRRLEAGFGVGVQTWLGHRELTTADLPKNVVDNWRHPAMHKKKIP